MWSIKTCYFIYYVMHIYTRIPIRLPSVPCDDTGLRLQRTPYCIRSFKVQVLTVTRTTQRITARGRGAATRRGSSRNSPAPIVLHDARMCTAHRRREETRVASHACMFEPRFVFSESPQNLSLTAAGPLRVTSRIRRNLIAPLVGAVDCARLATTRPYTCACACASKAKARRRQRIAAAQTPSTAL